MGDILNQMGEGCKNALSMGQLQGRQAHIWMYFLEVLKLQLEILYD